MSLRRSLDCGITEPYEAEFADDGLGTVLLCRPSTCLHFVLQRTARLRRAWKRRRSRSGYM